MEKDNGGEYRVQYYCGQRERAGGSVKATPRPLWYCEAATAVAPGTKLRPKLQPPQRIQTKTGIEDNFFQEPEQNISFV